MPFKEDEEYESKGLGGLSRCLSATGWFNSVVAAPEFDKARKTKVLPLKGMVSSRIENTVKTGVGYSTGAGPRMKTSWKRPWVSSYGHSLTASANISALGQASDLNYKMSLLRNPLEQYCLVQGGPKHTDLNDTGQDSTTFATSHY